MKNNKTSPTSQSKRKKDNITIIALSVVVVIMLICLAFMFLSYSDDSDELVTSSDITESTIEDESVDSADDESSTEASTETATETSTETSTEATTETTTQTTTETLTSSSTGRIIVDPETDMWNLIVVNSTREFSSDYEPTLDEIFDTGYYLDYRVTPYYEQMYTDALADGVTLTPFSAYRSYARQESNYNARIALYMTDYNMSEEEAIAATSEVILPPGTSEHNLGIAIDIVCVEEYFEDTDEFTWLMDNAYKYGFILRYREDKSDVTGVIYEPWHWRYVGVEYAEDIMNSGLCLEEYLDSVGIAY